MNLSVLAWRNLCRRPARSLLTVCGLSVAVASVVALVGLAHCLESSFLELYRRQGADLVVQRRGGTVQISKGLPLQLADQIRNFPETREVISGLMDMISFENEGLFMVIANGWEATCPVLDRVHLLAGRRLQAGDNRQVMLGRILAANLDKHVGDTIELYAKPFEVVGVFESASVYENGAVFLLMETLQLQMDRLGQATGFIVQANPPGNNRVIARLRHLIEALDRDIAATPCAEFVGELNQMKVTRAMSWVVSIIAVTIGTVGIFNTISMTIAERASEIGALRAMGWRGIRVMELLFVESLLLAVAGTLMGTLMGLMAVTGLSWWRPTSGLVQGDWPWSAVGLGILMSFLMVSVGTILAGWRIARLSPVEAMQR